MFRSLQLSAALTLVLSSAACSSAGRPAGAAPASSLPVATELRGESEPAGAAPLSDVASAAPVALAVMPAPAGASRRASPAAPLSALTQIVTAQALLVSLLLTPLSSAAAAPARAEGPR